VLPRLGDLHSIVAASGFGGAVAATRLAQPVSRFWSAVDIGRGGSFPQDSTDLKAGLLWKAGGGLFDIRWLYQTLADAAGRIVWDVSVDSAIARAHQYAAGRQKAGLKKEPRGGEGQPEPADHCLGRCRGGWATKLHLGCGQSISHWRSSSPPGNVATARRS
jgi:hypothetical protein